MLLRLAFWMCLSLPILASEVYFSDDPAVSPDGQLIVFSFNGDLWQVDAKGGNAMRLTGMEGGESRPVFAPNGRSLAFTATQAGNEDVYVLHLGGGEIQQLTFHGGADRVDSWSWDSQVIYFTSNRANNFTTYQIPASGGTPKRLFNNFYNTIHNLVEHPQNSTWLFTDSWESYRFDWRPKYQGDHNPDIKVWNPKTKEVSRLTTYRGKDFHHSLDRQGTVFFVSDEGTEGVLNLFQFKDGQRTRITNFDTSVSKPRVSADGSVVAFVRDFQLWRHGVRSGKTEKLPLKLPAASALDLQKSFAVAGNITHFDVAPDGKKLAFSARGQLFVSDIEGQFVQQLQLPAQTRALQVQWLSDSKELLLVIVDQGWRKLARLAADGKGQLHWLTDAGRHVTNLSLNEDRSQAAFLHGRDQLKLLKLADNSIDMLSEDAFWGLFGDPPRFSPDGTHLAYSVYRDFERDIHVMRLADRQVTKITETGLTEQSAVWSPDQHALIFAADRDMPTFPTGGQAMHLYRLPLQKRQAPLRSQRFQALFEEKGEEADDKEEKLDEIVIDSDELIKRWEAFGPTAGSQFSPQFFANGDKQVVLYFSNHEDNGDQFKLTKTVFEPFKKPKTEVYSGAQIAADDFSGSLQVAGADGKFFVLIGGNLHSFGLDGTKLEPLMVKHDFEVTLRPMFQQMYYETWANLHEYYYSDNFNGADWDAVGARFAKFLPQLRNREDLRQLQNALLGELNSSHTGFGTEGEEEVNYFGLQSAYVGIDWADESPFMVRSIVKDGPADFAGIDIKPGDLLVGVNDESIKLLDNRERYFAFNKLPEEIKLTFKREGKDHHVWLQPERARNAFFDHYADWVRERQQMTDKLSDEKIAYVHMYNMTGGALEGFMEEMVSEANQRQGLVLDLRFNRGGNVHDAVLQFLSQKHYANWKFRGGALTSQPNFTPAEKPIALLINYQTLSDGEMTAAGFKQLKLGKVFGTETYRWLIFTTELGLVDGSFHRMPSWGCYSLDGEDLELEGVAPDERVEESVADRAAGRDPQLEAAIKWIQGQW